MQRRLMQAICETVHSEDKPLVLKGGTALLLAYNLQRFSEDLDFDLTVGLQGHINLESLCRSAVRRLSRQGLNLALTSFKVLKKTEITHRCRAMFSAGETLPPLPLKLEVSARSAPDPAAIRIVNGIKVYSITEIARQKLLAAQEDDNHPYRTAARDLHDLAFIAEQWVAELPEDTLGQLEEFCSNPECLLERYAEAYNDDPLLQGRLYEDLNRIERWMEARGTNHTLTLFGP